MKSKRSPNKQNGGKVQIIAGRWRRSTLPVANAEGLRPTGNRIRETLFNWLMPHIQGACCLDLFAGTGSLGLEALSRGARFVQFTDTNTQTLNTLRDNLKKLNAEPEEFRLENLSAAQFLSNEAQPSHDSRYDIVFVDPPFQSALWQPTIELIQRAKTIADDALIYVERPIETKLNAPLSWREHRTLNAGKINATLYRSNRSET